MPPYLLYFADHGNKSEARLWELYVFPMGSDPERNLSQWGLQCLLEQGWPMNIQVMAELRNKNRTKKRQRWEFQTATFSFEKTENDELKKRAKKQYSEFLETLDLNSLKKEVESPCFGSTTEDITVKFLTTG